jgi:hypothetical protein
VKAVGTDADSAVVSLITLGIRDHTKSLVSRLGSAFRVGSIPIARSTSLMHVLTPFSTNNEGFPVDAHGGAGDI